MWSLLWVHTQDSRHHGRIRLWTRAVWPARVCSYLLCDSKNKPIVFHPHICSSHCLCAAVDELHHQCANIAITTSGISSRANTHSPTLHHYSHSHTTITISHSVVAVWSALEELLHRNEGSLTKTEQRMQVVRVELDDGTRLVGLR